MTAQATIRYPLHHFHMCCGSGAGAKGFNMSNPRVGNLVGDWICLGGVDVDLDGLQDFEKLTGVKGTQMDLFTRDQYTRFHGKEPPVGWKEATPEDIRRAAQNVTPHACFISSPCKGATGLLPESMAGTPRYQALNELTLRCIWLMLEAWKDDPVPLILFENVPRLKTRGRHLLDQIGKLLSLFGYAFSETAHDCGEIGNLAASRKRFLLIARHTEKVPAFIYEPPKHSLRPIGDVLSRMPLAGDVEAAGPMHRVPSLQWQTWVRLALVKAGGDWRSLNEYAIEDGYLRGLVIIPEYRSGYLGVHQWEDSSGTITGRAGPTNGAFSVADPRVAQSARWNHGQQFGVHHWTDSCGTIPGQQSPGQGRFAIADPRPGMAKKKGDPYLTGGHYGVVRYDQPASVVSASARHDNGRFSVADPRLPEPNERLNCIIRSLDNTWHRPFTTLELAALQSFFDPEDHWSADPLDALEIKRRHEMELFELYGSNDSDWRQRIGNAVPPKAAKAIADVMGTTLLLAATGETFVLSNMPIWVRPIAMAISVSRHAA